MDMYERIGCPGKPPVGAMRQEIYEDGGNWEIKKIGLLKNRSFGIWQNIILLAHIDFLLEVIEEGIYPNYGEDPAKKEPITKITSL